MHKAILPLIIAFASFSSQSADFEFSTGGGTQYGGFIGIQGGLKFEKSRYFAALGLFGVSAGAQFQMSNDGHHSLGVNGGTMYGIFGGDKDYIAMTYNYHFKGFHNSGWEIGTGVGYFKTEEHSIWFSSDVAEEEEKAHIIFNIGYKF
ncbi:hypothetical protein N474_20460 [Pseudoalteromonas luteoviolacea CPMOR-2]|uniref:Outer membrane protein beta-barrel domain-containing protein n=1 Tax=Pseudoalteromonas luteoviolacea DSM 6061 TaxID=1365250 RepID=A0A166YYM2_9GAMM|nr:hypothetical protein [Pseudoalteromonas luteoviolacea]KZN43637.1 hypothetical protein N475_08690 [Pseudoalteromonas luteoviolacea DSM 6061]KZN53708.1 hypothetical protein N474_20460 [Pseudoalteromonas luteoviolacea CPMOR-2]MBE0386479.1 hypothetical protein [Pseudoalteromonas luteoviolacea DSM 6061]